MSNPTVKHKVTEDDNYALFTQHSMLHILLQKPHVLLSWDR